MSIWIRSERVGIIVIDSAEPDHFTAAHVERLSAFQNQIAIGIENARLFAASEERAVRDELTGALNRRGLFEYGQMELIRAQRFHLPVGAILLDIDHYKLINDSFGHDVGDQVLRAVVRQCLANIREIDILGRYGGDEFVVLLPECNLDSARQIAGRLVRCIENHVISIRGNLIHTTISIGVTATEGGNAALEKLIREADQALYAAKQAGRNCICYRNAFDASFQFEAQESSRLTPSNIVH